MSLFLFRFFSPLHRPLFPYFFNSPLLPSLFSFYTAVPILHVVDMCFSLYAWLNSNKKLTRFGFQSGSQYCLLFFPHFFLGCIYLLWILAKMARAPCHYFGSIHSVNMFLLICLNPYAQNLFICINKRGIVHQKMSFSCVFPSDFLNMKHLPLSRTEKLN